MKAGTVFSVALLIDSHDAYLTDKVRRGSIEPSTQTYYRYQFRHLRRAAGDLDAATLRPDSLVGRVPFSKHFNQCLKALFAWALEQEFLPKNPFRSLKVPAGGRRERVLTRPEMVRLYRASPPRLRRHLLFLRRTMARPVELRLLRWQDVHLAERAIVLTKFKAKKLRRDQNGVRRIPLDRVLLRILRRWKATRQPDPAHFVFPAAPEDPDEARSYNADRIAMRNARRAAGLNFAAERVVFYTLRHTAATNATRNGVRDRLLADMLGHTTTVTTARYQHLDTKDLVEAIDRATARPAVRLYAAG